MKEFDISTIKHGYFFTAPLYLDEGFVLLAPEMAFSKDLFAQLLNWQFRKVFSDGEMQEFYGNSDKSSEKSELLQNDSDKIAEAQAFVNSLIRFTVSFFEKVELGMGNVSYDAFADQIKLLADYIKDNKKYILQVENAEVASDENFNVLHCVRTAIVSIIIGNYFKYPIYRIIELGIAALVHEIGMVKIPSEIARNKTKLSGAEWGQLHAHPTLGYDILKSQNFPLTVCLPALEHHERENGTGYPRKLTSGLSDYSKIIAVACSYAAITENRPHRDARGGYDGVTALLRNEGKQYDDNIVRALVLSLSVYPIGQYVELSNGRKGQVIDTDSDDPRYPIVQIFGEQTPDGKNKVVATSANGVFIKRPTTKEDV
jgi:HD-GYP domain-containing protein (c-di-GMP phosphodiesterase class II)